MADITVNPFQAVHNECWLILTDSSDFSAQTKPGNYINYVGARKPTDPEKPEVSTEDMSEVRIIPGGIVPHLQNTSSSSRITMKLSIEARSGSKDVRTHYDLIWAIYKAMRPWATRLTALTIAENGSGRFVVLGRPIGDIVEDIERGEVSKGIEGWFAIWTWELDLWFKSSALS